ncbi:MAG TPA: flagellar assembly protein FliW [Candidatus Krumholzibacteria bacterium]|nr:flagellar assembly protein FliW [Candidatus Krumholzibacteria bacterium]
MRIESQRIGTFEVDDRSLIQFPSGLVGLPARSRFVILEFDRDVPLAWMQHVDDPEFGLPVADPGIFVQDYQVEVPRSDVADLDLGSLDDAVMLVVTTIHHGGIMVTGNLRAPLVVNLANRRGRQIVLDRPDLDVRALVDPIAFARASRTPGAQAVTAEPVSG